MLDDFFTLHWSVELNTTSAFLAAPAYITSLTIPPSSMTDYTTPSLSFSSFSHLRSLVCHAGAFPHVTTLLLEDLPVLEQFVLEEGTLPSVEVVMIASEALPVLSELSLTSLSMLKNVTVGEEALVAVTSFTVQNLDYLVVGERSLMSAGYALNNYSLL